MIDRNSIKSVVILVLKTISMVLHVAVRDWIFMTEEYLGRSYGTTQIFLKHQNSEDYNCEMSIQIYNCSNLK